DLSKLLAALKRLAPSHHLMVLNDTFVLYPAMAQVVMQRYARGAGTDWLAVMSKVRDYDNLHHQFNGLQQQLQEKEAALGELKRSCDGLQQQLQEKEVALGELKRSCDERDALIRSITAGRSDASGTVVSGARGDMQHVLDSLQESENAQL